MCNKWNDPEAVLKTFKRWREKHKCKMEEEEDWHST